MHISSVLVVATAILPLTGAWRVGLWGTGVSQQHSGSGTSACRDVSAIRLGQATFDANNGGTPTPSCLRIFTGTGCNRNTEMHYMTPSLTGVNVRRPGVAKSFSIGTEQCNRWLEG